MELKEHTGDGIRYSVHLSAPKGGLAQMVRDPDGNWVHHFEYGSLLAEVTKLRAEAEASKAELVRLRTLANYLFMESQNEKKRSTTEAIANDQFKSYTRRLEKAGDDLVVYAFPCEQGVVSCRHWQNAKRSRPNA
jgi:hypothetical protein